MLTLGAARVSGKIRRVAAFRASSDEFVEVINEATEMLMERGSWWNTVRRVNFCSYNNCIVFPREVGTLLALSSCGQSIPPKNHWYSFNSVLPDDVNYWQRNGSWAGWTFGLSGANAAQWVVDGETTSVFNQIPCPNARYLRFYPVERGDIGKQITVFGVDGNGLEIRSERADGTFQDGIVIDLDVPYAQSPILVSRVDRIIKDPTDGPIYGYQWDGHNTYNLATYEASETLPEYRRHNVVGGCCNNRNQNCGCAPRPYSALVKLQFVPVQHDDDRIQIDNVRALAFAIQSIRAADSFDKAQADAFEAQAVRELNLQLRNKLPIDWTVVRVQTQGSSELWKQRVGILR